MNRAACRAPQRASRRLRWSAGRHLLLLLALGVPPALAQISAPEVTVAGPLGPAAKYVALGLNYYRDGHFDQAYVAFRAATESDAGSAEAWLGLGRTQAQLRLYSAAQTSLRKLLALDPANVSAYIALAQSYSEQFAASSDRGSVTGNLDQALAVLQSADGVASAIAEPQARAVALAKVWNQRSVVQKLRGDYPQALAALQRARTLDPQNSVILFNLGDLYYASGNLSAALDNLQRAVIADPTDAFNRAYYAKLLALSGNTAAARLEAAQAARLGPDNAYAVGQDGVVAYLSKDARRARTQLDAALKLDPLRYPEFYYYLGRLELDASDLATARSNLTKAVALASNNPEYLYYLGLSYEQTGQGLTADRVKARSNYQLALTLSPGFKLAQEGLSRVK